MTRHLVAIPGGAHSLPTGTVKHLRPSRKVFDWADDDDPMVPVALPASATNAIVQALKLRSETTASRPGNALFADLAREVREKVHPSGAVALSPLAWSLVLAAVEDFRQLLVDRLGQLNTPADLTPPHGIPRPTRG